MFELEQIMRQRESKEFAEILNRLREGNHTSHDIAKIKERCISENCKNYPIDVPHFFIQNSKVDEFNARESKIAVNADVKAEMQRLLEKGVSNFL